MANFEIDVTQEVLETALRKIETGDPVHADVYNALFQVLINNDAFLDRLANRMIQQTMIAHVLDSVNPNMVLGADQGPVIMEQIRELNSDLNVRYNPDNDYVQIYYDGTWINWMFAAMQKYYIYNMGVLGLGQAYSPYKTVSSTKFTMTMESSCINLVCDGGGDNVGLCVDTPLDLTNMSTIYLTIKRNHPAVNGDAKQVFLSLVNSLSSGSMTNYKTGTSKILSTGEEATISIDVQGLDTIKYLRLNCVVSSGTNQRIFDYNVYKIWME